jgi:hypothetical protein
VTDSFDGTVGSMLSNIVRIWLCVAVADGGHSENTTSEVKKRKKSMPLFQNYKIPRLVGQLNYCGGDGRVLTGGNNSYFKNLTQLQEYVKTFTSGGKFRSCRARQCPGLVPSPIARFGNSYLWLSPDVPWRPPYPGAAFSAVLSANTLSFKCTNISCCKNNTLNVLLRFCAHARTCEGICASVNRCAHQTGAIREPDKHSPMDFIWLYDDLIEHELTIWSQYLRVGLVFFEQMLFSHKPVADGSPTHVLAMCHLGLHRSATLVMLYLCVKYIEQHSGLGKFTSLKELWTHYRFKVMEKRGCVPGDKWHKLWFAEYAGAWLKQTLKALEQFIPLDHGPKATKAFAKELLSLSSLATKVPGLQLVHVKLGENVIVPTFVPFRKAQQ